MPTTTNYSWPTPADTDLVKNGAGAIRSLATAIDTTTKTNADAATQKSTLTTKGDIYAASASSTPARLGVGSDGYAIVADSTQTTGLAYKNIVPSQTGNNGKFLTTDGTNTSWAYSTGNGYAWTQRISSPTGNQIWGFATNGTNLYVAVGAAGTLYSSTDGKTWTSRTSGFGSNDIRDVAYGNGIFVAVGANGTITSSTDGTTWTARTANMSTNPIYQVVYANSYFVAVGNGGGSQNTGGITYSTDGITWTRVNQSTTGGSVYQTVVWNGTNWIVGNNSGTTNYMYCATPGGTWTVGTFVNAAVQIARLHYDGTRTIVYMGYNTPAVYYSTSATLASPTQYTGITYSVNATQTMLTQFAYYNGISYVHTNGLLNSYSPASTAYVNINTPYTTPLTQPSNAQLLCSIFVNSLGIFLGDQYGRIYTSF